MTYHLAADAGILVVDGRTTIRMGSLQLRADLSPFAAPALFQLAFDGFATPDEAVRRLTEAGEPPGAAARIVAELLSAGVLVEAENMRWARAFHRQSGHGRAHGTPGPRSVLAGPPNTGDVVKRLATPFGELLDRRRSVRSFSGHNLDGAHLDALLWAGFGMTGDGHRTVPSAGGIGGVRPVVAVTRVAERRPGMYRLTNGVLEHYAPLPGELDDLFATGHISYDSCSCVIFLVVGLTILGEAYSELGYRFGLLEAGHCAQNVLLAAEALGCAAVPAGALDDDVAHACLGLGGDEFVVYAVVVGTHA
jgi:SagB-type dehydrogenase family enzyme